MEKVYEKVYGEINFIERRNLNVFIQMLGYSMYASNICLGHLQSGGWKQLDNYPNDFKVILTTANQG